MKLADIISNIVIDPRKLTEYALSPDNPLGRDKALMFQLHLGFTTDNYELLLQQIEGQALDCEAILRRTDEHGQHYRVDIDILGVQGQREVVRTGWVVAPESDRVRLTTLYVRRR